MNRQYAAATCKIVGNSTALCRDLVEIHF